MALLPVAAVAKTSTVELPQVQNALKTAQPGDTIKVSAGTYSDLEMKWEGRGTAENPVVVIAGVPGMTVITGSSSLKIYGEGLTVSSFVFKDGRPVRHKDALVEFRNGDRLAGHCRLTDCVIDSYNAPRRDFASSYVHIYGRENIVDRNSFVGKKSLGVTLIVMLNHDNCDDNHHRIENNYFGYRPVYGSNGAETIRVGTSQQCMQNSRTIIRNNFFYRCNGEVEVISIKSSENRIEGNILYECEGVLALRHGDRNIASDNVFVGNGRRNTGGIRIVGEDQIVRGNRLYSLAGDRFFSALALMNAVPNSLPNRYMQVKGCEIHDNEFIGCTSIEFGTGNDFERTLSPVDNTFKDNLIYNQSLSCAYEAVSDVSGNRFSGNRAVLADGAEYAKGCKKYKGSCPEAPALLELLKGYGSGWYMGCYPYDDAFPRHKPAVETGRRFDVGAEDDICGIVKSAPHGSVIFLTSPLYELEHGLNVSTKLTIRAAEGVNPEFRFVGRKGENMITICDGADLTVQGIFFNGVLTSGRSLARAGISTAADMLLPYNLVVDGCSFANYGESGFIPVKGTSGTFAERVEIRNSRFEALSGDAVNYAAELEDKGRYNADDLIIENCIFERILGLPVNVYRGGSDESTAGPYVYVRGCGFNDCCNKVRGSVIRIIGAQILEISDCSFIGSGRGGYSVRLDDAPWEKITVRGLTFTDSGGILSNRDL